MPVYFLDSSALVKLYVREIGTAWLRALADPAAGNRILVAQVAIVEAASALFRRVRAGSLSGHDARRAATALRADAGASFDVIALGPAVIARALAVAEQHALRGYDCIHLATALELRHAGTPQLVLVSADQELNAAARLEGLAIEDPNLH